jgi:hypothetical protein
MQYQVKHDTISSVSRPSPALARALQHHKIKPAEFEDEDDAEDVSIHVRHQPEIDDGMQRHRNSEGESALFVSYMSAPVRMSELA